MALAIGFDGTAQTVRRLAPKRNTKTIHNDELLLVATRELEVPNLRRIYGKAFTVQKISRNIHEPAVRDTLLAVVTAADKLRVFSNRYNAFLLAAEITSQRVTFGKGARIGTSRVAFCKAFGLPATFDNYQITDGEGRSNIYFQFRRGVLASVIYDIGWLD